MALIEAEITGSQRQELQRLHETLLGHVPLAGKVHCAYVVRAELAGASRSHLTWAHGQLLDRAVSQVSRRELGKRWRYWPAGRSGRCPAGHLPAPL